MELTKKTVMYGTILGIGTVAAAVGVKAYQQHQEDHPPLPSPEGAVAEAFAARDMGRPTRWEFSPSERALIQSNISKIETLYGITLPLKDEFQTVGANGNRYKLMPFAKFYPDGSKKLPMFGYVVLVEVPKEQGTMVQLPDGTKMTTYELWGGWAPGSTGKVESSIDGSKWSALQTISRNEPDAFGGTMRLVRIVGGNSNKSIPARMIRAPTLGLDVVKVAGLYQWEVCPGYSKNTLQTMTSLDAKAVNESKCPESPVQLYLDDQKVDLWPNWADVTKSALAAEKSRIGLLSTYGAPSTDALFKYFGF